MVPVAATENKLVIRLITTGIQSVGTHSQHTYHNAIETTDQASKQASKQANILHCYSINVQRSSDIIRLSIILKIIYIIAPS